MSIKHGNFLYYEKNTLNNKYDMMNKKVRQRIVSFSYDDSVDDNNHHQPLPLPSVTHYPIITVYQMSIRLTIETFSCQL